MATPAGLGRHSLLFLYRLSQCWLLDLPTSSASLGSEHSDAEVSEGRVG